MKQIVMYVRFMSIQIMQIGKYKACTHQTEVPLWSWGKEGERAASSQ